MTVPFTSLIVCTYNRERFLPGTLDCAINQDYPKDKFEIIVIDNNSTDSTPEIIAKYKAKSPLVVGMSECKQGVSHARNSGIAAAKGEIVAFLDDDILIAPDWLRNIAEPIANDSSNKIGVVGGYTESSFPDGIPNWAEEIYLSQNYFHVLTKFSGAPYQVGGGNMAVSKAALLAVKGFDPDLGRSGKVMLSGEDRDFVERIAKAGFEIWYNPQAKIQHLIPAERLTLKSAINLGYNSARSSIVLGVKKKKKAGKSVTAYLLGRFAIHALNFCIFSVSLCVFLLTLQFNKARLSYVRLSRSCGYFKQIVQELFTSHKEATRADELS